MTSKRDRIKQARAIYYAQRERQLAKLEKLGLLEEYAEFCKGHQHNRIALFVRKKGIWREMYLK